MEFVKIIKSVDNQPQGVQRERMRRLAELLDKDWNNEYRQYIDADCRDGADENSLGSIPSSFQKSLVQLAWLPSKVEDGTSAVCLYQGQDLFADNPLINKVLDCHVPYIGAKLANVDFVRLLGIKVSVSPLEVFSFLQEWSSSSIKSGSPFTTSVEHMREVYIYLINHNYDFQAESLNDFFKKVIALCLFQTGYAQIVRSHVQDTSIQFMMSAGRMKHPLFTGSKLDSVMTFLL